MGVVNRKLTRKLMSPHRVYVDMSKRTCGSFFLDSGAHTIYTLEVIHKNHEFGYAYYRSKAFKQYVDRYAAFLKENKDGIDFYANVDAIFEPDLTWRVQKYLEREHGLRPVPVIHYGTDLKWVDKYLDAGYDYLGIGGLGQEVTKYQYVEWADSLYQKIGDKDGKPRVKTHGFAMTSYSLMTRYPWYSVDSASWAKSAGFGSIFVPHKRNGAFTFAHTPYVIGMSWRSEAMKVKGKHFATLAPKEKEVVLEWLAEIGVPLGKVAPDGTPVEDGVFSQYNPRALANAMFYDRLCKWLPPWPWAFKHRPRRKLFQ